MCGTPVKERRAVRLLSANTVSTPGGFFNVPIDCVCVSNMSSKTVRIQIIETLEIEIDDAYHAAEDVAAFLVSAQDYLMRADLWRVVYQSGDCYIRESRRGQNEDKLVFYHDFNAFAGDLIHQRRFTSNKEK